VTSTSPRSKVDGTGDTLLRAGVLMRTSTCESLATFIGSYVVLLECAAGEPPSARPLTTFAEPAWTPQTIFSSGTPGRWSSEQVLFANAAGLQVAPLAGGSPFVIDPGVTTGTGVFGRSCRAARFST